MTIAIPVQTVSGINGGGLGSVTFTAADAAEDHEFVNDGRTILLANNGSGSAIDVTLVSVPDPFGRTQDVVVSVAAGELAVLGPFPKLLWTRSDGLMDFSITDDTSLTFAAVRLEAAQPRNG